MLHNAWSSIEEVPYCFSRSSVKFQGHTALKIIEFDPNWAFLDCNSSLNSPMATKCCTTLEVAWKRCPTVFQGHLSNCKVTRLKKIVNFDPNYAVPDCNSSFNSPMATKWCKKLKVAKKRCPIVFRGHPSNFKVTRAEKWAIWIQFKLSKITRRVAAIKSLRFALFCPVKIGLPRTSLLSLPLCVALVWHCPSVRPFVCPSGC